MAQLGTMATAIVAATAVVAVCGPALAQTRGAGRSPGPRDFDACNREAEIGRGASVSPGTPIGGSASPRSGVSGGSSTGAGSSVTGAPGAGSTTGRAGATSAAGATGGTGSVSGGSTLSDSSTSATGDLGLPGIAAGQTDPAYQQAYRDCLRRRGY